ncbi:hypothetical protein ACMU_09630 [Actibacterium mucosum KCTC 23349]|uniref:SURF1-like protein n=1 Tax=Actibacterium mucosum KCTC 23349 TaxID=1454373 RepID=A0A037ZIT2_9RHOB|nr:SURF1 family protein [Actibacterium mucosum]KAJ56013.1 hypothetical protein ACMU_09630 [Actibacterium mucosum KCTC 23349]
MLRRAILPLIFGLAGAAALISLGLWQMQRLEWKEGVLAEIEAKISADPVPLGDAPNKYQPVRLQGDLAASELHVLVSRKLVGAGYRVIVAMDDSLSGQRVLLDRGFVALDARDDSRPAQTGLTVTGNVHIPDERSNATPDNDPAQNIWFARDIDQMAAALNTAPILVVARSDTGQGVDPWPVGTEGIPNDHLNYAITWFSLAFVWLGMTALFVWRIRRQTD